MARGEGVESGDALDADGDGVGTGDAVTEYEEETKDEVFVFSMMELMVDENDVPVVGRMVSKSTNLVGLARGILIENLSDPIDEVDNSECEGEGDGV